MKELLINTVLNEEEMKRLRSREDPAFPYLFAIVGDISIKSEYCRNVLLVSEKRIDTYELDTDHFGRSVALDEIVSTQNKRMYGNAIFRLTLKSGETVNIFRYTFSVNALSEAAAGFIQAISDGVSVDEAYDCVKAVYEKQLSVCPKCGRTLSSPGATCIHCASKKKVVAQLGKYLIPEWKQLVFSVLLAVASTALSLVPPLLTKSLVDDILPNKDAQKLLYVAGGLVLLHILTHAIGAVRGTILRKSGDRIVMSLRNDVYEKAQYLPMRFYDKTSTGAVINRISGDSNTLRAFMLRITQEVVVEFFKMIGIIVVMLIMNPKLTLLSLVPVPLVVIGARIFGKKIRPFYLRIWRRWTAVSSVLTDTIPGIRVVKSFTNEEGTVDRFKKENQDWYETDAKASAILNIFPAIVNTLISIGSVVIWIFGGNMVISGSANLTTGLLVSFISYASMFYGPVNFFANLNDSYQAALASAERILDILDAEPEHNFGKGHVLPEIKGKIEFKNVSFSFDRTKKTLKNINLTINPGDIVGIVGTTGSGKSTLINLFMRYYDHYDGDILVDGVNIKDIDMQFYRGQIGFVQQEPLMFHDTIFNNIAYGVENCPVERVLQAADIANAHEFIVRQPDGYDAVLGERGVGLSGGERQRVSIARAVLKNPSILVFDEATASVDSETEHLIQEAIERLISGRTTIMIAHRLSTLSKANKIVVVDNGEIIECGSPDELLAAKGKYYRLVEIQSMSDKLTKAKAESRFD
ncbi:MAG: ABC transporter ATP-binding protein [Eubacteriales bacterium]|nr:ABC transporter ATP-binding protein/permease [Clostridiales bacterium]MDD7594298.1 ABC transporter ATP-binding protein [Clostridiales bacterium]MDY4886862.1 ABC transporter ATP-binding protein [Eubacteriales bacterium]